MTKLNVYDPPMCCSTGVCGPDGDDELAQFASALEWAQKSGVDVARYDLGHQPGEFANNELVRSLLDSDGMDCLPLVVVDGEVFKKGGYPSRNALADKLGLEMGEPAQSTSGCCGGDTVAETPAETDKTASGCC